MKWALSAMGVAAAVIITAGCTQAPATGVVVYKSASCGCCKEWIRHLEASGFAVKAYNVLDLAEVKRLNGVSPQLGSCHTARVEGYVIEGHVPVQDIKRLLAGRPAVTGLTVPGMPAGSPGMEGSRKDPYKVYAFTRGGSVSVYARY